MQQTNRLLAHALLFGPTRIGVLFMSEGHLNNWVRTGLLLAALAAGTVATQFVPKYQEASRTITYPSKAATVTNSNSHQGVSGVDVDEHRLTLARTKS
jgi:hypothetical protein